MDFFVKSEILNFVKIAGHPYEAGNTKHQRIAEDLKTGVWEKTRYWMQNVLEELDGFSSKFTKKWEQRGRNNGKITPVFKPYTWARIYRKNDDDKGIYFTIGVDAETEALVYKLDYNHSEGSPLSRDQQTKFVGLTHDSPANWQQVNLSALSDYTWPSLTKKTVDFIRNYMPLYDEVMKSVWPEIEDRGSRLTWNTNGWVFPSGPTGKSETEESHEGSFGYGHEEWLFDVGKIIDDYHYGFLEPIRKQQDIYAGKSFNVWLYTIDGASKKRYWVGNLDRVEVISNTEAKRIKSIYLEKGWLKEMEEQIIAAGGSKTGFSNLKGIDIFNVRFKSIDLLVNDPYYELPKNHPVYNQSRYVFFRSGESLLTIDKEANEFEFLSRPDPDLEGDDDLQTSTYHREPKTVEITHLHTAISRKIIPLLKSKFGKENVSKEQPTGYGCNRIDVVVRDRDDSFIFYEIKTYNSPIKSVREAIGQLMEYAYWPNKIKAKELVIVTQKHQRLDEMKTYMEWLRRNFSIPIYYQTFDLNTNSFGDKL